MVWGALPEEGLPLVKVVPLTRMGGPEEEDLTVAIVKGLHSLRQELEDSFKKVWVILGIGDALSPMRMKEVRLLSPKRRVPLKPSHLEAMRLKSLSRAVSKGYVVVDRELIEVEVDGISYPGLPKDKGLKAHSVVLSEYLIGIESGKRSWIKSILRRERLKLAGILPREILISKACFSQKEMDRGGILVDIGFNRTVVLFWKRGTLVDVAVFPYGGKDLTSSIMKEFGIPFGVAEEFKRRYVDVDFFRSVEDRIRLDVGGKRFEISGYRLCKVVHGCIEGILEEVKRHLFSREIVLDDVVVGITGGVCMLDGVVEMTEQILGLRTKMAFSKNQSCLRAISPGSPYALIAGAFWRYREGKIDLYSPTWKEKVMLALQELWDFF